MPKYTKKLSLFKWDTEDPNDLSKEFDVEQALNENWDKVDNAVETLQKELEEKTTSSSYEDLDNKPSINNVELSGNKTLEELGIQQKGNYAKQNEIPTKTSDLDNDSDFINKTVSDLINYYNKTSIDEKISAITSLKLKVVVILPTENIDTSTIYLLPKTTSETNNVYEEYIYVNNQWEKIGSTDVDLTDYVTKQWVESKGYLTEHQDISGKQDKLVAGDNIVIEGNIIKVTGGGTAYDDTKIKEDIKSVDDRLSELEKEVHGIETDEKSIYGIRRLLTDNTSTTWERIEDSTDFVANAKKEVIDDVRNDFDNCYPWREIKSCNVNEYGDIVSYYGEPDFAFDGSNGEVMTRIPTFWYKREIIEDNEAKEWEYIYIASYEVEGYTKSNSFLVGRYNLSTDINNVAHSIKGNPLKVNTNITTMRSYAKNLSTRYCLLDYRFFIIQLLYLVEYADFNSQNVLGNGIISYSQAKTLIEEENTNRFIVSSSQLGFYVGKTIAIGSTGAGQIQVAYGRTITEINDYVSDDGSVKGKEIIFDGEPVNIVTNNTIWGCAQIGGDCDELGMSSGCLVSDNYHSMIYRGIENIFGNVSQILDGINIQNGKTYICKDPSSYAVDVFTEPYKALDYINLTTSNSYALRRGCDSNEPAIAFPTVGGGSTSTGVCDIYYYGAGNKMVAGGGDFNSGLNAGLFCLCCSGNSNGAFMFWGARLLKYQ